MCNLYSNTLPQEAMRRIVEGLIDRAGNVKPGQISPNDYAPIVRHGNDGLELVQARWGMPSPKFALKTDRDPGVRNVRNLASAHWRRWLGPDHRCLVPVTSFAEPLGKGKGNQWFASPTSAPMMFAGIELRAWTSLRKVKDGETTDDLYAFLTCDPNGVVAPIHPKAMPVILTDRRDWSTWLSAPIEAAVKLQRPIPDDELVLVEDAE